MTEVSVGSAAVTMVTVMLALSVGSAAEVAVMVTVPAVAGAVNWPEFELLVPVQVTAVFDVPETVTNLVKSKFSFVPMVHVGWLKAMRMPESRLIVALATAFVL